MTRREVWIFLGMVVGWALLSPLIAEVSFGGSPHWTSRAVTWAGIAVILVAALVRIYLSLSSARELAARARTEHPGAEVFLVSVRDRGRGVLIVDDDLLLLRTAESEVLRVGRADVSSVSATLESTHTAALAIAVDETTWVLPVLGERVGLPRGERSIILIAERIAEALERVRR